MEEMMKKRERECGRETTLYSRRVARAPLSEGRFAPPDWRFATGFNSEFNRSSSLSRFWHEFTVLHSLLYHSTVLPRDFIELPLVTCISLWSTCKHALAPQVVTLEVRNSSPAHFNLQCPDIPMNKDCL